MKSRRFSALLLVWKVAVSPIFAEQIKQNPEPAPPPQIQGERDEVEHIQEPVSSDALSKVALARVWYFGSEKAPKITVVCAPPSGEPVPLGTSLSSGRSGSYSPFRPGNYTLNILSGSVIPNAGNLPLKDLRLADPVPLALTAGKAVSLVVLEKEGKFSVQVFDEMKTSGTGPNLRILDFSGLGGYSLFLSGKTEKEIWNSATPTPVVIPVEGGLESYSFQVRQTLEGQPSQVIGGYETTLSAKDSLTIVIFNDRYGERAVRGYTDSKANLDFDLVKALGSSVE